MKCGVKVFADDKVRINKSPLERSTDKTARELDARQEVAEELERAALRATKKRPGTTRGTIVSTRVSQGVTVEYIRVPGRISLVRRERKT